MTTLLTCCRVADYDTWRPGYDRAVEHFPEIRSWRVWRGQDDPNFVVTEETFDSREVPERLATSTEVHDMMERDGVDMSTVQLYFLDEVGSGSR